ncbi:amino acid ABC transporter permease [Dietzia lutea]|uniref:ABC transporter permease n=1 Tax=Dietzia lutea TaxID=546160 RepID=A0A2S1RCU1_9ACTN|nr:amino acid ABC transporter permease [Dietzia lutea]AWH94113.1 ABC transporter permease [Dietzia lutea]
MSIPDTVRTVRDHPRAPMEIVARRYYGRWVAAALAIFVLAALAWGLCSAEAMQWDVVGQYLFAPLVLVGVLNTLLLTISAATVGVAIGTMVAVMRLSKNPVLWSASGLFQWFFRGTPILVQLLFWFNLSSLVQRVEIPFLGISGNMNDIMTPYLAALLGLGLNFGAYYSEVVRAGILSVDEGQEDAAAAYGLTRLQTLRIIILPQAMRVIIPPTGNELIGLLKYTSLASIVAFGELTRSVNDVYSVTYQVIPLLVVASIWYLIITSVLNVGQYFLERRFSRGTTRLSQSSRLSRLMKKLRSKGS